MPEMPKIIQQILAEGGNFGKNYWEMVDPRQLLELGKQAITSPMPNAFLLRR